MSSEPTRPRFPGLPHRPRNPGDAWAVGPDGTRYWGRFGAAGLLAVDAHRGILLQHRAAWSHFGGTWGLPGGARHEGEEAATAALREAGEEAGVPDGACRVRAASILDLGFWSYATILADVITPFEPRITDAESAGLAWVPVEEVDTHPLHPGFATAWPALRALVGLRPAIVVDIANVMGSVPDGWWRDRAGAATRLLQRLDARAPEGVPSSALGLPADLWFPEWVAVVEGQARRTATEARTNLATHAAVASGDDEIVAQADRLARAGRSATVVTSDRGLAGRVAELGAETRGARWLLDLLADDPAREY